MTAVDEPLERLKQGNRAFVAGLNKRAPSDSRPFTLVQTQQPFAAILGCADARVPAEIVFGQGIGDLFVIRVAGNIATAPQIGSVEFAVQALDTRLVVVLGHSECGGVQATVDALLAPDTKRSPNLEAIVASVRPAVEPLLQHQPRLGRSELVRRGVRANIQRAVSELRRRSSVIAERYDSGGLQLLGAEYCLATGEVVFLHESG